MTEFTRFEIARLELQPGDTLVIKTELVLSQEQVTYIREIIVGPYVPEDVKIMVLSAGLTLEVLRENAG